MTRETTPGKTDERAGAVVRLLAGTGAALLLCWLSLGAAGAAHADETTTGSHNGPRVGLLNVHVGQIDDPAEDVLEHTLLFGDGYAWN
ncbi:hypothetical protein [Streptomyces coelicoflavus]|uniref:Uncharacterized protein n=1 Tax=Streptomyces coelicoflavus TaxID=285562 RepID=A0A6N9UFJ4_9ACTN|nr:hypothetical protein [Streptomyces coelicoflavus]NEB16561.1 hypothetical protein [Streptomyces coelicoflavus]